MCPKLLEILFLCGALLAQTAQALTIDTVPIGNPGNRNDQADGDEFTLGVQNFGAVAYVYNIGKYDTTVGQYTAFLNSVAAADPYDLYNPSMAAEFNTAGIGRSGASGSYSYSVIGSANHPISWVSWGDAARFANWLHNGQPAGDQGPGTTETGAYTLNGALSDTALAAVARNGGAKWFIPSENEWYKAAYYDPAPGHYWKYATGSNTTPISTPPGSTPNTANYYSHTTGYAVTRSTSSSSGQNYLTDVGAYTASASPYGTFDQGGNVDQWDETLINSSIRGVRGGNWNYDEDRLLSLHRFGSNPTYESGLIGFRVATVAEPSTAVLAILSCGAMWWLRKRSHS
jgi:formylglycine-generating enzyme